MAKMFFLQQSRPFVKGSMNWHLMPSVMVHAFQPSTIGGRGRWISAFEVSLVYRASSRSAKATRTNPVLKNKKIKNKTNTFEVENASLVAISFCFLILL